MYFQLGNKASGTVLYSDTIQWYTYYYEVLESRSRDYYHCVLIAFHTIILHVHA